ncbi:MAG: IS30 family transposase [bacterium]
MAQNKGPFTLRERSIIEVRWRKDAKSVTDMATELGRNKSSVSRELAGKPRKGMGRYRAEAAHAKAQERIGKRGNTPKMKRTPTLKAYVEEKMREKKWSPEQVHIRLPLEYPDDPSMRISTEAVYQEVYRRIHRKGRGSVKPGETDLRPHLARRHKARAKQGFRKARRMARNEALPSIEARPEVVNERSRIGDWEDDTMVSRQSTDRVKSMTERRSGVTFFEKAKDGTAVVCDEALIKRLSALPKRVRKTLTRDRGTENVRWEEVKEALDMDIFFAHPYSSCERGSNENANGLARRFFPKKTDWSLVSDEELARAERLINTRPRKRHGGLTPEEVFWRDTGVAIYS